ncbi:hypothetical protein HKT18_07945 [Flavobacterium sp. IMCC34852]|uniref:Lipoprotein n=1 Tax=Flavobacterium rivulicola TaxID=2732161 RepID=A0A7Y3R9X3_9FLAO|nr:hypothetical protein [Flavobacterium sp. IMCC34852]NNT72141.1 hypothetical protein [Flavobacterium sp. IMCC34852]
MRKTQFFKEILILICILTISACKSNLDQQFSLENERIKEEFTTESQKFVEQNREKLSEKEMLKSLDSITEEYIINKNKKLAVKFIKSESGVKRLNLLKKYFTKEEIKVLLKKVPEKIKADTNYVALKKYCR